MIGVCDSCDCEAELFQLPGRRDNNCSDCDSDIATMVLIYEALNEAERRGMNTVKLEDEVMEVLLRILARCGMGETSCR